MSTQTDVDIEVLVGEMPVIGCEHSQHGKNPDHADEDASHYIKFSHGCGFSTVIYPACPRFVAVALQGFQGPCNDCTEIIHSSEAITILGPVNK